MGKTNLDPRTIEAEGQHLFEEAQYHEAAKKFSHAHRAYAETGDELKAADMLNNVGIAHRRAGKHKEAASALEQTRKIVVRLGDRQREAQVLGNLGGLYSKMKRYDESAACFQAALELFGAPEEKARRAETLRAMAIMQFKRGHRSTALQTYERAVYALPYPTFLQRLVRFLFRIRGFFLGRPF